MTTEKLCYTIEMHRFSAGKSMQTNKTAQTEGYISFSKRANDGANWEFFVFFEKNVEILAYSK